MLRGHALGIVGTAIAELERRGQAQGDAVAWVSKSVRIRQEKVVVRAQLLPTHVRIDGLDGYRYGLVVGL
jgi:hypothetical protein